MTASRNIRVVFWNRGWLRAWKKYSRPLSGHCPLPEIAKSEKVWARYMKASERMERHGRGE